MRPCYESRRLNASLMNKANYKTDTENIYDQKKLAQVNGFDV